MCIIGNMDSKQSDGMISSAASRDLEALWSQCRRQSTRHGLIKYLPTTRHARENTLPDVYCIHRKNKSWVGRRRKYYHIPKFCTTSSGTFWFSSAEDDYCLWERHTLPSHMFMPYTKFGLQTKRIYSYVLIIRPPRMSFVTQHDLRGCGKFS